MTTQQIQTDSFVIVKRWYGYKVFNVGHTDYGATMSKRRVVLCVGKIKFNGLRNEWAFYPSIWFIPVMYATDHKQLAKVLERLNGDTN